MRVIFQAVMLVTLASANDALIISNEIINVVRWASYEPLFRHTRARCNSIGNRGLHSSLDSLAHLIDWMLVEGEQAHSRLALHGCCPTHHTSGARALVVVGATDGVCLSDDDDAQKYGDDQGENSQWPHPHGYNLQMLLQFDTGKANGEEGGRCMRRDDNAIVLAN